MEKENCMACGEVLKGGAVNCGGIKLCRLCGHSANRDMALDIARKLHGEKLRGILADIQEHEEMVQEEN